MEEAIIKHLTGVLQSQIGDCLPVTSLGSHLSDLGKKKKNYLKVNYYTLNMNSLLDFWVKVQIHTFFMFIMVLVFYGVCGNNGLK